MQFSQTVANNMKKRLSTCILVLFIFSSMSCTSQENQKIEINKTPNSFKILDEIEGDLDKDGVSEKVIVYDTEKETDFGIERNCIVIHHFGGSRQKWNYTHRFRYQSGDFQLIGATVRFGSPCDYFFTFDYNLSNGKINYKKETEDCKNGKSKIEKDEMIRKLETLPTMNGFYPGNTELKFPQSETTIYY